MGADLGMFMGEWTVPVNENSRSEVEMQERVGVVAERQRLVPIPVWNF